MSGFPAWHVPPERAALIRPGDLLAGLVAAIAMAGIAAVLLDAVVAPVPGDGPETAPSRVPVFVALAAVGALLSIPFAWRARRRGRVGWLGTALGAMLILSAFCVSVLVVAGLALQMFGATAVPSFVLMLGLAIVLSMAPFAFVSGLAYWAVLRWRRPEAFLGKKTG